jgi:serine phosphatase RsbU (regulator of sigma subunit)
LCDQALARTRGVALAVASLTWSDGSITWLSVGNVAGLLLRPHEGGRFEREHILMRGGVVGHRLPPLHATRLRLQRGDILVFATDGIRERFQDGTRFDTHPQEIADRILARFGKATDDALVLVGKWHGPPPDRPRET